MWLRGEGSVGAEELRSAAYAARSAAYAAYAAWSASAWSAAWSADAAARSAAWSADAAARSAAREKEQQWQERLVDKLLTIQQNQQFVIDYFDGSVDILTLRSFLSEEKRKPGMLSILKRLLVEELQSNYLKSHQRSWKR